jgi:hypothetical protein
MPLAARVRDENNCLCPLLGAYGTIGNVIENRLLCRHPQSQQAWRLPQKPCCLRDLQLLERAA